MVTRSAMPGADERRSAQRRKANLMMAAMVTSFIVAWLPVNALNLSRDLGFFERFPHLRPFFNLLFAVAHLVAMTSLTWWDYQRVSSSLYENSFKTAFFHEFCNLCYNLTQKIKKLHINLTFPHKSQEPDHLRTVSRKFPVGHSQLAVVQAAPNWSAPNVNPAEQARSSPDDGDVQAQGRRVFGRPQETHRPLGDTQRAAMPDTHTRQCLRVFW